MTDASHDEQHERRRDALAQSEWRQHMQYHIDELKDAVTGLRGRVDNVERTQTAQHRENSEALHKINTALFDDDNHSRLTQILDLMTTLRMNGKAIAWIALVVGGIGTIAFNTWKHVVDFFIMNITKG